MPDTTPHPRRGRPPRPTDGWPGWPRLRSAAALAAVVLGLGLGGCALNASPPPTPIELPAAWSTGANAEAGGAACSPSCSALGVAWWSRFNDATLTALEARALQANTSVLVAQAALRQARALRDAAAAGLGPTLGSSASAQRSSVGGHSAGSLYQAGLDASWEIDAFGGLRSALQAGEANARASAASLGDVQVSIAAELALDYIALRGAQARLQIANDNLASQQETLQITEWRLQAGLVSSLEVAQARTAAEQTRALLPALQTTIDQSGHALAVLTGQPPAALAAQLAAAAAVPQAADDLALSLPADTLRQRPDVRAAEWQVEVERARLAQADAARLPAFTLSGSLGLSALTLGTLGNSASVVGALLGGVTLPLFDGGALRAQVRAQQATLDQATQAWRASVLVALQEVEDALVALRGDRQRLLRLGAAAESASNAALMARQRYASGLVDFQTVLETQRTQLSTQDGVASAGADVSADHVRLYKALGGGWLPDSADAGAAATPIHDVPRTDPS